MEDDELTPVAPQRGRKAQTAPPQDDFRATEREGDRPDREADERDYVEDLDDLEDAFLDQAFNTILPSLPPMPGYHLCWLTTGNPSDSIQKRLRLGYELLRTDWLPGWTQMEKNPAYDGVVTMNEMVAARIPLDRYNKLMRAVSHRLPLEAELAIKAQNETLAQRAADQNVNVFMGDGTANVVNNRAAPVFRE